MSHNLLGRLPPLQTIGRSKCIDLDDPPIPVDDDDDDAEEMAENYLRGLEKESGQSPAYCFSVEHAALASEALTGGFKVLQPGDHYCKKVGAQAAGFIHCEKSIALALKHRELNRLLATRARLEFTKDLALRMSEFAAFVGELRQVVKEESRTWHLICRDTLSSAPTTRLEQLCGLCEDLRMQLNQWDSIKQSMHTTRHLRALLPSLCANVAVVRRRLAEMSRSAMFWLNRLILVGFKVLAHCDLERIGQDALWNIARGLEEYNMIARTARVAHSSAHHVQGSVLPLYGSNLLASLVQGYSGQRNEVTLEDVLRLVANERSKYAAASAKVYFMGAKEFLALIKDAHLSAYSWSPKTCDHAGFPSTRQPQNCGASNARGGQHGTIASSTSLHVTGSVFAPDLSSEISPLIDFGRRESTFIGRFLQIVCRSTNLIKKQSDRLLLDDAPNVDAADCRTNNARTKKLLLKTIAFGKARPENRNAGSEAELGAAAAAAAERVPEPVVVQENSGAELLKADPARKSVSWGDSSLVGSIQHAMQDYLRILWLSFADHIRDFLLSTELGNAKDAKEWFGSIVLCPFTLTMIVKTMIENAALGDTFPLGCRVSLAVVSLRLHTSASMAAWDGVLNAALASAGADKMEVTTYSATTTGMLLQDTYHPLYSVLSNLAGLTGTPPGDGSTVTLSKDPVSCDVFLSVLKRLKVTVDVCYAWCSEKTCQLIASRSVSNFLLVAFGDLVALTEEYDRTFHVCKLLYDRLVTLNTTSDQDTAWRIGESWRRLNESHCHLQVLVSYCQKQYHQLCLSSSRDFFQHEMPSGKEWKRKSSEALPVQHLEYIERAVDSLLEPVVSGVSRLQSMARFDVLSAALTSMCDAWTSNILTKKIRFSYHGACQLELDVLYLKTWLASYISDTQLCHHLTSLEFIQYLDCVILLLKQQPSGHQGRRSGSRVRQQPVGNAEKGFKDTGAADGTQSISNASTCTPSSDTTEDSKNGVSWDSKVTCAAERSSRSYASMGFAASLEDGEPESRAIPHKEQWLALRVHGGSRNWPKLSSCFNNMNA